jgi:hypothetical protein
MQYSDATIERTRQEWKAGAFNREVKQRRKQSLYYDELILSCGHQTVSIAGTSDAHENCTECMDEWAKKVEAGECQP